MKTKLFLMAFCLGCLYSLQGQKEVELNIIVFPTNALIKIDDQLITKEKGSSSQTVTLSVGKHIISLWSPSFSLVTDTIEIIEGKTNVYKKALRELSPEFKRHKEALEDYQTQKVKQVSMNTAVIAGNAALLWYLLDGTRVDKLNQIKSRAEQDKFLYESSIIAGTIEANRLNYERHVKEYEKKRDNLTLFRVIGIPVFLTSSYFSYRFLKKYNREKNELKKPVFNPTNPLTNLDWGVELNQFVIRYKF